ncbi:GNAT family N-acetyltransferase [Hymenobacter koreensis]|uniref:GNAT family N-acetyltransferase n=1 Tax=Hymenobacter koreensis TaxID=1084523 RepID=A0ABP8IWJ6_9BACT
MATQPRTVIIRAVSAEETYALRQAVLWPAKPLAHVRIAEDAMGHHFGAFVGTELVAVVSLFVTNGEARFRKFATHPAYQRQGIGSALLKYTFGAARRLGARSIWCDARQEAAPFYHRFGLHEVGAPFVKSELAYVRMQAVLTS